MGRPRLTIGSFGDLTTRILPSERFEARTRYRDRDGRSRIVQATADTAKAPEHLTLREIGVARCDRFIKEQARVSYNRAKQSRVVLRLALELAVRHEVLPANPMHHVSRVHREARMPDALTSIEVNVIRAVIARWESGVDHISGPRPDGQLGAIVEVMLGTSARIGEVLAIRRRDIDVTGPTSTICIAGTIISRHGEPTFRQDHPKTAKSRRIVALPSYTAEAVRRRLAVTRDPDPESLVFRSREGTSLTTANVRRQPRHVLELAGIGGVTPHLFRRTVATAVNDNASVELAAELLGHTDTKITVQHYIQRRELVNPATAELLERAFRRDKD